jgi:hypothetical protein
MLVDAPPPAAASPPRRALLIGAAMLTIVTGFGLGFALSGTRGRSGGSSLAAGSTSTAVTTVPTTARVTVPPTEATTTTTEARATTTAAPTTIAPTTTRAPTTLPVIVPTTPPPTPPPTQAPPTTYSPPKVLVTYAADAQGRLVVPRVGTATLTVTNQGGLASQWIVTGSGFSVVGGATQGTLAPGQSQFISIGIPGGEIPKTEITGIISVLGALNPSIQLVIHAV